jgi:hypothetical protein
VSLKYVPIQCLRETNLFYFRPAIYHWHLCLRTNLDRGRHKAPMDDLPSKQFICRNLYINCNPNTCIEAARRRAAIFIVPPIIQEERSEWLLDTTLEYIRRAMDRGCVTCRIISRAVTASFTAKANVGEVRGFHEKVRYKGIYVRVNSGQRCVNIWPQVLPKSWNDQREHRSLYVENGKSHSKSWILSLYLWLRICNVDYWEVCQAFPVQPIRSGHTNSHASLTSLKAWIQDCETLNICQGPKISSLPRRVIDVGLAPHYPQKVSWPPGSPIRQSISLESPNWELHSFQNYIFTKAKVSVAVIQRWTTVGEGPG